MTVMAMFRDKTKNPPPFAGDGFGKFILQPGYEFNLPPPTICVVPTVHCQAAHFSIQFILAMTGFIVRTRAKVTHFGPWSTDYLFSRMI
ncbi:MAG: hypothetical protein ACLPRE_02285 [Limisphaerales bacterium]